MTRRCIAGCSLLLALSVFAFACGPASDADGGLDDDAGPPLVCESDADCDDGLYCTGEETCVDSRCVRGAPVLCDDGVACSVDRCDDVRRACLSTPPDVDGDGAGSAACLALDGVPLGTDCDDSDPNRFVGNIERCDVANVDEDCDPSTFGAEDIDGDGALSARCCNGETCGADCDDTRAGVGPGRPEICNGLDEDCDGVIDEEATMSGFPDLDADGWGDDSAGPIAGCMGAARFSVRAGDCDDRNPNVHPELPELCDSVDNDCDTRVDESAEAQTWYTDADGDGYGSLIGPRLFQCEPPAGFSLLTSDCDDGEPTISPAAEEACNGRDDDCNGLADFAIGLNDFEDDDGDGVTDAACEAPGPRDCDDDDPRTSNEAFELCDGRDNDCDGAIDEGATSGVWYPDRDGDGYGDPNGAAMVSCAPFSGYAHRPGDCDDGDPARSPGGRDVCNGVDDDCSGAVDDGPAASCGGGLSCIDGACQLRCPTASSGDCDGVVANGCETDVRSNVLHCGACHRACGAGGTCTPGACDAVVELAVGEHFTCARRASGGVACWGDNSRGQLGVAPSALAMSAEPVEVAMPPGGAVELAAGRAHACVILTNGRVACWGANDVGQLGRGFNTESPQEPPDEGQSFGVNDHNEGLAAGADHTCVIQDDNAYCWGLSEESQIGNGLATNSASPRQVDRPPGRRWRQVAAGAAFTCGVTAAQQLLCWGRGAEGQQASNGLSQRYDPAAIATPASIVAVAAGRSHACALDVDGVVRCWGGNSNGQVDPARAGEDVRSLHVLPDATRLPVPGRAHTMLLDALSRLEGFGANALGQLGDGTTVDRASAVRPVGELMGAVVTGPNADHTCALIVDTPFCWGDNEHGQLGAGASSFDPTVPQAVVGL